MTTLISHAELYVNYIFVTISNSLHEPQHEHIYFREELEASSGAFSLTHYLVSTYDFQACMPT
jgi:hypothetical protein